MGGLLMIVYWRVYSRLRWVSMNPFRANEGFGTRQTTRDEGLETLAATCLAYRSLALRESVEAIHAALAGPDTVREDDIILLAMEV